MAMPGQDCSFRSAKRSALVARVLLAVIFTAGVHPGLAQKSAPPKHLGILASAACPERLLPEMRLWPLLWSLADRGWVEGWTLIVDCIQAGGRMQDVPALAADLVARKPDVLFGESTPVVRALKQATGKIPIVTIASDPLGSGIVTNLAHPEANVTGLAPMSFDLAAKRTELLRDVLPRLSRLALIGADPVEQEQMQTSVADVGATFEQLAAEGYDAVYLWPSPFAFLNRARIAAAAIQYRLPTISDTTEYARFGVLLSYGVQDGSLLRAAAEYVDKLLRGAKPADLPLQQPTKFELVINLGTAKALGLTIPQSVLLRADEVIE
jgi:putative tryptophan/tyrosine transport system substrate-binding protein